MMSPPNPNLITAALLALALAVGSVAPPDRLEAGRWGPSGTAIELAPALAEATSTPGASAAFFERSLRVDLPAGAITLAGSPDGAGDLCTDDLARISVQAAGGAEQTWEHLFAEAGRGAIRCIPAQTIPLRHGAGSYTVTIALSDRYPPVFSSRPYYLVPIPASPPDDDAIGPTMVPAGAAPIIATTVGTATPPRPAATPPPITPAPTTAAPEPAAPIGASTASPDWRWVAGAALAGLALVSAVILLPRRRPKPRLYGILDLSDELTGEVQTLLLHHYPEGVGIARTPLGPVADWGQADRPLLATIRPGPDGPTLARPGAQADLPVRLRLGDELLIDRSVRLRYR